MAQQTNNSETRRGPGRPPGSKNKPKGSSVKSQGPTKQEVADEMQRRSDRDKRNNDVIWSITFFAFGLFLFFTVIVGKTGSFGAKVHDLCYGLFSVMSLILPFLVIAYAVLLFGGKVRHIGTGTAIFGTLIYLNICILNSARFIDPSDIGCSFKDIANYYVCGRSGQMGGAIGMEIGSILVKLFGMPGLIIIAITVLVISFFVVANTPISRLAGRFSRGREQKRILKELEADGQAEGEAQTRAAQAVSTSAVTAASKSSTPFWKSILNGVIRDRSDEAPYEVPSADTSHASDIPEPFSRQMQQRRADNIEYTQVLNTPVEGKNVNLGRGTLFGKLKDIVIGIDSENGSKVTADKIISSEASSGRSGLSEKKSVGGMYADDRDFEREDEDFGYPGRKRRTSAPSNTGLGLGDPDEVGHSGCYGLDAHSKGGRPKQIKQQASTAAASVTSASDLSAAKAASNTIEITNGSDAEDEKIAAGFNSVTDDIAYEIPPTSLLKRQTGSKQIMSSTQLEERAELLEQTLNNFGVDAKVIQVTQGASVTRFEVQPAIGVKVSKITGLANDIALNMRAKSIRIEAPIPGKAAVGIEVENAKPSPVLIRELIESEEFIDAPSAIEFVVGKDISGNNIVADLCDMPHLLIAGATGSGKSVCINSIVTSFLYKARPSELKLIMVDPKQVELGGYNGIPHMLTPVVTDPRKAARALAIAVDEMEKRYELFAENNVKDLKSFNELMRADRRFADCKPQIVIIIDELADLMMASPSEVETSICRLAQKARAAGMHLIVATQRPSVDVVTGLIKSNIPSRIAFSVASSIDSRTILDMAGAEKLLGKGDMLFSPVGSTKPLRVQGPFISEDEIKKIIAFVKKKGGSPEYDEDLRNAIENADKKMANEPQDELTEDAIAFIFKSKQASVSMLQRRFRIGYNRAARIIDEIEEKGIIGPSDGSRPRQLLISEDEYYGRIDAESVSGSEDGPDQEEVDQPAAAIADDTEPYHESEPEEQAEPEYEMAPEDDGIHSSGNLSNTQAMDSFNSLPESVRRMIMDADSESNY